MRSALYSCTVTHERIEPVRHGFRYRLFWFALDLDEVDTVAARLRLVSRNRFNAYTLRDSDHLDLGGATLRENVARYLQRSGVTTPPGRITLLTHLRTFGYIFNPVSFYFIEDATGAPLACVAEVSNTYREMKLYLLQARGERTIKGLHRKHFYISPFSDLDHDLRFRLAWPDDGLSLHISNVRDGKVFFHAGVSGHRRALTDAALLGATLRFPAVTLGVMWAIHWQALRLWLKGLPAYPKRGQPHLQRDILQPQHNTRRS